jgi:hypothetical protein
MGGRNGLGAGATWDERQKRNETKKVWVGVGGQISESEGCRMTTDVMRNVEWEGRVEVK